MLMKCGEISSIIECFLRLVWRVVCLFNGGKRLFSADINISLSFSRNKSISLICTRVGWKAEERRKGKAG
jgi:hypothetical protein